MLRESTRLLLALVLSAATAGAWTSPLLSNVCSSAPAAGDTAFVHADIAGPVEDIAITAWVNWSTNGGASWTRADMARLGVPGWDSTWQGSFPLPGSGTVLWYVQSEDGSNWATQGPKNTADVWPPGPSLLAPVTNEPSGDMVNNPDGPFLDLTSVRFGWSDSWLYTRITNNDNQWPTRRGFLGPWYIYASGFRNPDAAQDTFSWVLVYADIPLVGGPGLYVINAYTEDFEQVGDIDYNISGNVLSMRCRLSTLTSHPKFGPWPIPSSHLRAARGDTRSVTAAMDVTLHDTSNQSRWYVHSAPGFVVGQNRSPALSLSNVVPRTGEPETEFVFSTDYTDPDSNLPVLRSVVVEDETLELTLNGHRWWRGATFTGRRGGFAPGVHHFRFVFSDGMATVTSPADSFTVTGVAVAELSPAATAAVARPNPFRRFVELLVPPEWHGAGIYSPSGRLVRAFAPGRYRWDGSDNSGRLLPAGIYYLRSRFGRARLRLLRLGD